MKTMLYPCLILIAFLAIPAIAQPEKAQIDPEIIRQWSAQFRGWSYYPDHVIPATPKIPGYEKVLKTDVPTVFQLPGDPKWYMSFIGFDGQGYQSFIAESTDLVTWTNPRLAMGYGPEGEFDHGGVVLGAYLYESCDLGAPRILKKHNGKFWSLYGAYPRQGGYELRPGYEGVACSDDGLNWRRAKEEPILSVHQPDCGEWEKDCIYQPWLVEHEGRYYNFYNAANGSIEQLGMAFSDNLLDWQRYTENPVIPHGPKGGFNEKFSSDGKVFREEDHWTMLFFGVGRGGAHIMAAYSRNLLDWTIDPEPLYRNGGHPDGLDRQYAHKISLTFNPANDTYYMFYNAVGKQGRGIGLLTSKPITPKKTPVIVVTDLYHPHQDKGDNFDLISAYALPEIDLKAVILDAHQAFRQPVAENAGEGLFPDPDGPREPGYIPVLQLNYIFGRNVPAATAPFTRMQSPDDTMEGVPAFEQQGIDLLLTTLRESPEPVEILSFGSARPVAVAYNREPALVKEKLARLHLCAGASGGEAFEWNVALDRHAIVCLLRSDLPVAIYPCAASEANASGYGGAHPAFSYDENNCYYKLPDLNFVRDMNPKLQRYIHFAFGRTLRHDYLRAMELDAPADANQAILAREHYVWETACWINAAKRKIVRREDGSYRVLPLGEVKSTDILIPNELQPCTIEVRDDGIFAFTLTDKPSNFTIFHRGDPKEYETALQEAVPLLYRSYKP